MVATCLRHSPNLTAQFCDLSLDRSPVSAERALVDRLPAKLKLHLEGPPERRKAKRQRPYIRVSWRVLGDRDGRFSPAEFKDIGRGGLALIVDRPCKQGTVVVVQVQGVEDDPLLLRVEWSREHTPNKWLVGCSFTSTLTDE